MQKKKKVVSAALDSLPDAPHGHMTPASQRKVPNLPAAVGTDFKKLIKKTR